MSSESFTIRIEIRIEAILLKSSILSTVQRSIAEGGLCVEDLPIDISGYNRNHHLHLIKDKIQMYLWEQEVPLDFGISSMSHTKNSMLQCMRRDWDPAKLNIDEMRRDWATQDFELYAAFDPLADKAMAVHIGNQYP
uniref:Uncharacterized protein n=1 Tax=Brassica oleracea var. oleracea TaxID=109376 RepID=A0A0D3C2K0_BRAOL